MRFKILLILVIIACQHLNAQQRLSNTEFSAKMKLENVQILDVRTAKEVAKGKIEGAKNIDYFSAQFMEKVAKLNKAYPVLIYCAGGGRSLSASQDLKKAGFKKVYDLEFGFDSWEK